MEKNPANAPLWMPQRRRRNRNPVFRLAAGVKSCTHSRRLCAERRSALSYNRRGSYRRVHVVAEVVLRSCYEILRGCCAVRSRFIVLPRRVAVLRKTATGGRRGVERRPGDYESAYNEETTPWDEQSRRSCLASVRAGDRSYVFMHPSLHPSTVINVQ